MVLGIWAHSFSYKRRLQEKGVSTLARAFFFAWQGKHMLGNIRRFIFSTFLCFALISYEEIKLEEIPRLNNSTALKILSACHQE
tara:strand:+ start:1064 stop:1315 length:252 start_codon:yes stop_codon:yes gene_type:complete